MEITESLRHRIDTARALRSIVMTMKALATASIHKCELAVESLAGYNRSLELGMYVVLQAGPGPVRRVRTRTDGHLAAASSAPTTVCAWSISSPSGDSPWQRSSMRPVPSAA